MTALGLWEASIDTLFFKETGRVEIFDNNGEYGFRGVVRGFDLSKIEVISLKEEGGTIDAAVKTPLFPEKTVDIHIEIDGDALAGYAVLPVVGRVKIKNGHRIKE
ncbi:MAG: hypothetical protein IJ050_07465 [Clostridia bacterium]|nr:hypothetical protein [Clostridia bacterium]